MGHDPSKLPTALLRLMSPEDRAALAGTPPVEPIVNFRAAAPAVHTSRTFTIPIDPCPAPRMTRQDRWLGKPGRKPRRPIVQRYFDFRDALRAAVGDIPHVPDELHAVFHFPMPDSWSRKKRAAMLGQPHRQRPDRDNCTKAVQDALFIEDGSVWKGSDEKRWAEAGRVDLVMVFHGK